LRFNASGACRRDDYFAEAKEEKLAVGSKSLIQLGVAFILLGIVAFTYRAGDIGGESAIPIWTVRVGVDAMKTLAQAPLIAALVLATGVGLVALGVRKSA
jgi:hypothetical protein